MRQKTRPLDGDPILAAAPAAAARSTRPALAAAVIGTCWFTDLMTGQVVDGTIVDGCFTVTGFRASDGALQVTGTLTGTCTAAGGTGQSFAQETSTTVTPTVTGGPGACRTLLLHIGAIDLDQRRLVVRTKEVVIAVTAPTGPGHMLGNLLEAVGNSLSSDAPATHLADLLDPFLTISR
jgi:hypothetical protein